MRYSFSCTSFLNYMNHIRNRPTERRVIFDSHRPIVEERVIVAIAANFLLIRVVPTSLRPRGTFRVIGMGFRRAAKHDVYICAVTEPDIDGMSFVCIPVQIFSGEQIIDDLCIFAVDFDSCLINKAKAEMTETGSLER